MIGLRKELLVWLTALGVRVPADIGFAHLDVCTERGDFAGIDQRPTEIGAAAFDLVFSRLLANERGLPGDPWTLLSSGAWAAGPTVRKMPG